MTAARFTWSMTAASNYLGILESDTLYIQIGFTILHKRTCVDLVFLLKFRLTPGRRQYAMTPLSPQIKGV